MSIKIKFNAEKCVGCYACHIACLDAHHEVDEADAKSFRAIRKVQKEGFEKNICPGCTHCGKCMEVCPVHAIYRDEKTGLILTDKELCVGCHVCENACPLQMIRFDVQGKMEKCDGCIERLREGREPACVRTCFAGALTVETVVLLSQQKPDDTIEIDLDLDELDATSAELKATYQEIKDYVLKEFGLKVSNLYISQVKRKCGIEVGENYNLPKSENARVPQCPKEKEEAIKAALKYFAMI